MGVKPAAMRWYAPIPGATAALYSARGGTQNPGAVWSASQHPGLELLLQLVERPGPYRG